MIVILKLKNLILNLKKYRLCSSIVTVYIAIIMPVYLIISSLINIHINTLAKDVSDFSGSRINIEFVANKNSLFEDKNLVSPILDKDISSIRKLKDIKRVSGVNQIFNHTLANIKLNDNISSIELYPFNEDGYDTSIKSFKIIEGRNIKLEDIDKNVIVLNQNILKSLGIEKNTDILNKEVEINKEKFEVIGVMEVEDNLDFKKLKSDNNYLYSCSNLVPKSTLKRIENLEVISKTSLTSISVDVFEGANIDSTQKSILKILKDNHKDIDGSYTKTVKECYTVDYVDNIKEKFEVIEYTILFVILFILLILNTQLLRKISWKYSKGIKSLLEILFISMIISLIAFMFGKILTVGALSLIYNIEGFRLSININKEIIILISIIVISCITTIITYLKRRKG